MLGVLPTEHVKLPLKWYQADSKGRTGRLPSQLPRWKFLEVTETLMASPRARLVSTLTWVLGMNMWPSRVIVIIVQVLGKYMIIRHLDP